MTITAVCKLSRIEGQKPESIAHAGVLRRSRTKPPAMTVRRDSVRLRRPRERMRWPFLFPTWNAGRTLATLLLRTGRNRSSPDRRRWVEASGIPRSVGIRRLSSCLIRPQGDRRINSRRTPCGYTACDPRHTQQQQDHAEMRHKVEARYAE